MTQRAVALLLTGCAVVGIVGGLVLHELVRPASTPAALPLPELHGQVAWAAGKRPAPAFALRDQSGRLVTLASLRGRTAVLTFLDSHCTSSCPLVGRGLGWAVRGLPESERPTFIVVSVNPKDTPESARAAVRKWGVPPGWHWLMGNRATLGPVWKAYGIAVIPSAHDIVHGLAVYLLDRHANERTGYLFPFQPPFVQRDLRTLATERDDLRPRGAPGSKAGRVPRRRARRTSAPARGRGRGTRFGTYRIAWGRRRTSPAHRAAVRQPGPAWRRRGTRASSRSPRSTTAHEWRMEPRLSQCAVTRQPRGTVTSSSPRP